MKPSFANGLVQRVAIDLHCDQGPIRPVSYWHGDNKIGLVYMTPGDAWRMKSRTGAVKYYAMAIYRSPSESGRWAIGDQLFVKTTLHASEIRSWMQRKGMQKAA